MCSSPLHLFCFALTCYILVLGHLVHLFCFVFSMCLLVTLCTWSRNGTIDHLRFLPVFHVWYILCLLLSDIVFEQSRQCDILVSVTLVFQCALQCYIVGLWQCGVVLCLVYSVLYFWVCYSVGFICQGDSVVSVMLNSRSDFVWYWGCTVLCWSVRVTVWLVCQQTIRRRAAATWQLAPTSYPALQIRNTQVLLVLSKYEIHNCKFTNKKNTLF